MKKILENKGLRFLFRLIKGFLTILVCLFLAVIVIQKVSHNNYSLGGYRVFSIVSESMLPTYEIGDILIAKKVDFKDIQLGDHLVYIGEQGDFAGRIITHEVKNIKVSEGHYQFVTKGIANMVADPLVSEDQVLGIIVYKPVLLSFIGQLMSNVIGYFTIFILVSILVSYQIVRSIYENKDEEDT